MPTDTCNCHYNSDTGWFEACCEEHEREYVDYLEKQKAMREVSDGK